MADNNPFLRKDYLYQLGLTREKDGPLQAVIGASFTIRNVTDEPAEYQSTWYVTDEGPAENLKLASVVIIAGQRRLYGDDAFSVCKERERVLEAKSAKHILAPHEEVRVEWELWRTAQDKGSELISFAYPTSGVSIAVTCPADIRPVVDQLRKPDSVELPSNSGVYIWRFGGVFENEQHIIVRWYPQNGK